MYRTSICVPSGSLGACIYGSGAAVTSNPAIPSHFTGGVSSVNGSPFRRTHFATPTHQPAAWETCTGSPGAGDQPRAFCKSNSKQHVVCVKKG